MMLKQQQQSKVLLVDDEASVLKALGRVLLYEDYHVVKASCPAEALEVVKNQSFDVIIADYRMPIMNGVTFLREASRFQPFSCNFILSGDADTDDVIECMNDDIAERFLRKPWDNKRIVEEVNAGVRKRDKAHLLSQILANESSGKMPPPVGEYSGNNLAQSHNVLQHLKSANFDNEFSLVYQPKVCAKTGRIVGLESLLRWNSPIAGVIAPDVFIPIAEEGSVINDIGEWVLNETARFQMRWRSFTLSDGFRLAFNVSPKQLLDGCFVDKVKALIDSGDLIPEYTCIEITESAAIDDFERCCTQLTRLSDLGIQVAIDDFGTGHTAINYLLKLPAHVVKLDRSLIQGVESEEKSYNVVKNVVAMAQSIGMKVVAEGIEIAQHALCLKNMGCEELQGYHYSRPLTEEQLLKVLAQQPFKV